MRQYKRKIYGNIRQRKLVKQYFEHFNNHEWAKMASMYAKTSEFKNPSLGQGIVKQTRQQIIDKYSKLNKILEMKKLMLLIISTIILLGCNQPKKVKKDQFTKSEEVSGMVDKTVSLSVKPNVFKLSEIPDSVTVTMSNNTNDTITTGLHYRIENYEKSEWKEISPKDVVFHDLGWRLKPTDSENFEKNLYKAKISYKAGKYRIVKYYLRSDYQRIRENFNVYAEFEVR